jgi:hypothetical protein
MNGKLSERITAASSEHNELSARQPDLEENSMKTI